MGRRHEAPPQEAPPQEAALQAHHRRAGMEGLVEGDAAAEVEGIEQHIQAARQGEELLQGQAAEDQQPLPHQRRAALQPLQEQAVSEGSQSSMTTRQLCGTARAIASRA